MFRTFWIRDAMHLNTVGLGNPAKRTCATCHGMHMMGMDVANGWMDIGTTNLPWAREEPLNPWNDRKPQLPLFKVTCKDRVPPHPFLGRVIYTQDPGPRADLRQMQRRGHDRDAAAARTRRRARRISRMARPRRCGEMVDFYDRRFNIGFTDQEREDLINFLSAL